MPLNMNTIGTGSGIGGSGSGSGSLCIENSVLNKTKKVSSFSDINISKMSPAVKNTKYTEGLIYEKFFTYDNSIYAIITTTSTVVKIRKYTIGFVQNSASLTSTDIATMPSSMSTSICPTWGNSYYDVQVCVLGKYVFFAFILRAADIPWLFRFDGESFTDISTGKNTFYTLFKTSPYYGYNDTIPKRVITPIFKKGNSTQCMISVFSYSSDDYYSGYTYLGIYECADDGTLNCIEKRKFSCDSDYNTNLFSYGDDGQIHFSDFNHVTLITTTGVQPFKQANKLVWDYNASTDFYTLRNTVTTENLPQIDDNGSDSGKYQWNSAVRTVQLSYPENDTHLTIVFGSNGNGYNTPVYRGYFLQIKVTDSLDVEYKSIPPTSGNSCGDEMMPYTYGENSRYNMPYVYLNNDTSIIIYYAYTYNSSTKAVFRYIHALQHELTYATDKSAYIYTAYLQSGDTVYCDDSIYSYEFNGVSTSVNSNKLRIPADGTYKISMGLYNGSYEPSVVCTNKNGDIVYFKYELLSNGDLSCYPLKGMIINGIKITESKKQTISADYTNRFVVSMK